MVDPHGSLSRNDTAAAGTLGVAPQSTIFRFQPVCEQYQRCFYIWVKSAFLKLDTYMRVNFSTKIKSTRCEGKVDWSCSPDKKVPISQS